MHDNLCWHAWSVVRKAQIIGGVVGLIVTVGSLAVFRGVTYNDDAGPYVLAFNLLLAFPTALIFQLLGLKFVVGPEHSAWPGVCVVCTNVLASALLASLAAWFWVSLKAGNNSPKS